MQQFFGNSIGCILTLSYSSQVLLYWKEKKRFAGDHTGSLYTSRKWKADLWPEMPCAVQ